MIFIYHNEECGTSRNVLSIIRDAGYEPTVIDYQKKGWTKSQLLGLFAAANLTPRKALRTSKSPADELGLLSDGVTDEVLIEAMLEHPILVNRPIVCTPMGVRLCRPSEQVLEVLEKWPQGPYHKEDGTLILDKLGNLLFDKL
ncbi:MAG: arsenate reductase [Glaciecola sp.]